MIRTRRAGSRALVIGLVVAAVVSGTAVAAMPISWLQVRARLAPAAGAKAAGRLEGVLVKRGGGITPAGKAAVPRTSTWRLTWSLRLPEFDGPVTAYLQFAPGRSAPRARHVLCTHCSTRATGTTTLTGRQVALIRRSSAVVVVRASSARWRGPVKVLLRVPVRTR